LNVPIDRRAAVAAVGAVLSLALVIWRVAASSTDSGGPTPQLAAPATLLADDFSSGAGWVEVSSPTASFAYAGGKYVLRLDRPADDGLSVLALEGEEWPSVAATATVQARAPAGGLAGVGCAAGKDRAYVGAVDQAGSGFVIVRATRFGLTLLRAGADERGAIRAGGGPNEIQVQCTLRSGRGPSTSIRLFANGRLLGSSEDRRGLGPFRGIAVGGITLRRPLGATFTRAALQSLPSGPASPIGAACQGVATAGSVEDDYAWLLDSGAARTQTPDLDRRQVGRVARELARVAAALRAAGEARGVDNTARTELGQLAKLLRRQGESLNAPAAGGGGGPVDVSSAYDALACPAPRFFAPPGHALRSTAAPAKRSALGQLMSVGRALDEELVVSLPAPPFVKDKSLPLQPGPEVQADLRYNSFRVFGDTTGELNRSLRVHAVHVESELAAGVTSSRFEVTYDPQPGPGGSGCTLQPRVGLSLLVTLPDWHPPSSADRYVRNQWNQFIWDLDEHERHHVTLWSEAAGEMAAAIEAAPSQARCQDAVAEARARANQVFRKFDRLQRHFDADVAAGRLPHPSLP
jgi:predicted secreted Zn-dependent protease